MLRPVLCLLACQAAGGDYRRALPAAAAIEMVHNFSLVHDDIQDQSPKRRHRPTVWWLWGKPQAINTGDGSQQTIRFVGRARDDNNWTFDGVDSTGVKDPAYRPSLYMEQLALEGSVNTAPEEALDAYFSGGEINRSPLEARFAAAEA